jgi:anti-sigma factor ChrR (cupin superfamily)
VQHSGPNFAFPALVNGGWHDLAFEHFREGIEVHWLLQGSDAEPSVAILRYRPGASVPRHRHPGLETIMVLEGTQSDESGDYAAGTVVLNPVGTEHSVWTKDGCLVLIQWALPVIILGDDT